MTELDLTLETMERDALADLHAAAPPELRQRLGMRGELVDGCFVSVCATSPAIVINRAIGLGVYQPATADTVSTLLKLYEQAGIKRFRAPSRAGEARGAAGLAARSGVEAVPPLGSSRAMLRRPHRRRPIYR